MTADFPVGLATDSATDFAADFAAALRSGATPRGLRVHNGSDAACRFAVHRNHLVVSLTQALAEVYPAVRAVVGEAFFDAMAARHVLAHPPRSPVLAAWGGEFAGWLEGFEPAAAWPWLPDVARLEWARVYSTHAADAAPLAAAALAARWQPWPAPERLAASRLRLHPSLTVLASCHAVVSRWAAHQGRSRLEGARLDAPECALVLRQGSADAPAAVAMAAADAARATATEAAGSDGPDTGDFVVVVLPLGAAPARFVRRLHEGATLAEAGADALVLDGAFDAGPALAHLLSAGAVVGWDLPGDPS